MSEFSNTAHGTLPLGKALAGQAGHRLGESRIDIVASGLRSRARAPEQREQERQEPPPAQENRAPASHGIPSETAPAHQPRVRGKTLESLLCEREWMPARACRHRSRHGSVVL